MTPRSARGTLLIDCAGSLLGANMPSGATRSDVQIDGQNAYDAVTAVGLSIGIGDLTSFLRYLPAWSRTPPMAT